MNFKVIALCRRNRISALEQVCSMTFPDIDD